MRPTGASFRPTEYLTFFVKIETQAHTFHKATLGRVAESGYSDQHRNNSELKVVSRTGGTQDTGCVCCLTKGHDFRQSIAREPPQALAAAPEPVP